MIVERVTAIAANTVREAVRNKLLYTLLFFAVTLIGAGVLISMLSYVESERILQDVGFSAVRLMSVGIAVFVGVGLIHGEVDRRTIYTILSKPISRAEFLVGKYLGLVATTWLVLVPMGIAFAGVSWAVGAPLDGGHAAAFGLVGVELIVIVGVATLFSAFTTPMLASLFTVGIYLLGHLSRNMLQLGQQSGSGQVELISGVLYRVLPDLESFNVTLQAAHQLPIPTSEVVWPICYGVGYALVLLFLAAYAFERRDLR